MVTMLCCESSAMHSFRNWADAFIVIKTEKMKDNKIYQEAFK